MKGIFKTMLVGCFFGVSMVLAGCHTVSGTVNGMGKDISSVTGGGQREVVSHHETVSHHEMKSQQAHPHKAHHKVVKKKKVQTTTTEETNMNTQQNDATPAN